MGDSVTVDMLTTMICHYFSRLNTDDERVAALNLLRKTLHRLSPFNHAPVDCVLWVKAQDLITNDYNPNVMAPVEKRLLKRSLLEDGFTQPIVVAKGKGHYLVVDGFHRLQLGKSKTGAGKRLQGYIPVTLINPERKGLAERIATTIRHNRARGKHQITSMSDIVRDLAREGWGDNRIAQELGMDEDEVLRLKQISGLTELFQEEIFSKAWTVR